MPTSRDLLSEVWREACRHIEIEESATAIAKTIASQLPLRALFVLRVDTTAKTVETLATGTADLSSLSLPRNVELSATPWRRLAAWLKAGNVVSIDGIKDEGWAEALLPKEIDADALVGPLRFHDGPAGILLLVAQTGKSFSAVDHRIAQHLLEPFTVAVENHGRLHELRSLREAAEADRQTLLSRLGKQDVNEDVVGARTGLRHVMERVELVARSDVPVLILGETGTGKEVVSRAIHTRSKRGDGPFIRVNCGAIPPELIDSQLFGHEKGSFTGASAQHQGWFERADRGTLFLDEIGELPLPAQVRLLRVLQDHQIERVGGRSPVHVDVRIVAATHRDLAAMAKERTFREDLWYRINTFPILLPTLHERLEDVPALVRHFVQRATTRFGLPAVTASDADLQLLIDYEWPGNIRELGAVIDRAVILGGGRRLEVSAALGLGRRVPLQAPADSPTMYEVVPEESLPLTPPAPAPAADDIVPLDVAMSRHIERALAATRGRVEGRRGAAALLRINPHTLRARMRKLRIDVSGFRD
ncbi:MAG: sigma-54 dependent transcriptional regulator [Planctomycetia bacterium]|nr:sigma-54 dependent transcriptional regulator [Planctomycetia bacterium]